MIAPVPVHCISITIIQKKEGGPDTPIRKLSIYSGNKPYNFPMCGELLDSHNALARHVQSQIADEPDMYAACGKSFARKGDFMRRELIQT